MNGEFPLEKILTCTPTEYCASVGRGLGDFELKGIHVVDHQSRNIIESFRRRVPGGTEVVVGYFQDIVVAHSGLIETEEGIASTCIRGQYARGIALILRKQESKKA